MSVQQTREVHPELSKNLPDEITDKSEIKQAFREASTKVHPDQGGQDEDFKEVLRDRNYLLKKIDENDTYQIGFNNEEYDYRNRLQELDIEEYLNDGIEEFESSKEDTYDINHLSDNLPNKDIYSIVLDDKDTELMIGLEIDPIYGDSRKAIEAHATYFSKTGEKILEESGCIDLENMVMRTEYQEVTHESLSSAIDRSVQEIGSWAVEYAENKIKQ